MDEGERIYALIEPFDRAEAERILADGTDDERAELPLRAGEHLDWKKAQDLCLKLMDSDDPRIRANAALGLAYAARTNGRLDKRLVKPYLLRELRRGGEFCWRVIDAISDINALLGWHLGERTMREFSENRE